ncbi:ornithine cyclodeaminase [Roseibium aquae]|uniref:Ornithine cyclodeaminase n=1 Tax=Roseibium aquae TaxID=1323746 RepID=A0A916TIW3_9HYPH|nr:ornithine cyclodeaminase [Roseibium aquae]GGB47257.1 ornithine cyclodeaminase [Roseibium aquae]
MRIVSGGEIDAVLGHRDLIETMRRAYRSSALAPPPATFQIPRPPGSAGVLRALPAWTDFQTQGHTDRGYIGCQISLDITFDGSDPVDNLPGSGIYLLFSGHAGQPVAMLDGRHMALWRKAAVHALASSYFSREDSERLLVIGHHPVLPWLLSAHSSVRNLRSVLVAGVERVHTAKHLSSRTAGAALTIGHTEDLKAAAAGADIIVAATPGDLAEVAEDVPAGVHIDLLRENGALPGAVLETCRLFTADRTQAPLAQQHEVAADLHEVARGEKAGRRYYSQQTLFSCGPSTGLADLATAGHIFLRT